MLENGTICVIGTYKELIKNNESFIKFVSNYFEQVTNDEQKKPEQNTKCNKKSKKKVNYN
jgi:hypothetical protein